jgi:NAD(P)-dependent dehydrogenase (short-subunit alcohol dehydrogenase family)
MKRQLAYMREQGGGAIVNTGSTAGIQAVVNLTAYNAAKHGIVGLTQTAATEYAADGIRVNVVHPGGVMTPPMAQLPQDLLDAIIAPQPLHRYAAAEEIAAVAVWLCSNEASFVTGVSLPVDGGSVAWLSAHLT